MYEENIKQGNLEIINFRPYYESALRREIVPFHKLELKLEAVLKKLKLEGKVDKIMVFADAAGELSKNEKFIECEILEKWWNDTYQDWIAHSNDITVICPHPSSVLNYVEQNKLAIQACHSRTLDLEIDKVGEGFPSGSTSSSMRLLIAEPNADLRSIYGDYFKSMGYDIRIVETAGECLKSIAAEKFLYDVIVLDTYLKDMPCSELAQRIRNIIPEQRIIFTTTSSPNQVRSRLSIMGIVDQNIVQKPFRLSQLLSAIYPLKMPN